MSGRTIGLEPFGGSAFDVDGTGALVDADLVGLSASSDAFGLFGADSFG